MTRTIMLHSDTLTGNRNQEDEIRSAGQLKEIKKKVLLLLENAGVLCCFVVF